MAKPLPGLDMCFSPLEGTVIDRVPVVQIYGSTPGGQKTCVHLHKVRQCTTQCTCNSPESWADPGDLIRQTGFCRRSHTFMSLMRMTSPQTRCKVKICERLSLSAPHRSNKFCMHGLACTWKDRACSALVGELCWHCTVVLLPTEDSAVVRIYLSPLCGIADDVPEQWCACSASLYATLRALPGECHARWAGVWSAAPPESLCCSACACGPILWVPPGGGALPEDRHVRPQASLASSLRGTAPSSHHHRPSGTGVGPDNGPFPILRRPQVRSRPCKQACWDSLQHCAGTIPQM